jgi:CheY-like chemotaxis protein
MGDEYRVAGEANRRRVLVVDDNRDAANMLALLISELGHETRVAFNGDAALAAARRFRPDVVFLDLVLPDGDGADIARELRREPGLAGCCIYSLSAYVGVDDRLRAIQAGCAEHYVKPIRPSLLPRLIGVSAGSRPPLQS